MVAKIKEARINLFKIEPYFIEKELLPILYFKEDKQEKEYWIFFYRYIRKLSDEAIGVRLGYERKTVYNKTLKIIENNFFIISRFLHK